MDSVYVNQGMTEHILSDRGLNSEERVIKAWLDMLTSPYKPSSNSMTESIAELKEC